MEKFQICEKAMFYCKLGTKSIFVDCQKIIKTGSQQILSWCCLIAIDVWGISVFREGIVIAGSVMIVMVAVIAVSSDFLRIIRDLDLLPVLIWQAFPHNTCAL